MKAEEAFTWFIEPAKLKKWLVLDAQIEPAVGGKYELYWDLENKNENSTIDCKITTIEQNKILAFEWKGPIQYSSFMNRSETLTHVSISFIPIKDHTEIHLIHSGWGINEEWQAAQRWFDKVWEKALLNLVDQHISK